LNRACFYIFLMNFALCRIASAFDYYVATNGNDAAAGTYEAPFATISKAVSQMNSGDRCIIRGGRYHEEIIVSDKDNLTFAAYPGERVIFDGSTLITNSWTRYSGNIYITALKEDIWQLFADGEMLIPARWPNADPDIDFWEQWESEYWAEGRASRNSSPPVDSNGIMYDKPHDGINLAESGLNISNAVVVLNVGSFRTQTRIVSSHIPGSGMFTYPPVSIDYKDKEHFYFVEGKLELLDAEKEWFFDPYTKRLYVWIPGGQNPADAEIRGKTITYCFKAENCAGLTISGIHFFAGTFYLDHCERARVEHCELTYPSCSRRMLRILGSPQTTVFNCNNGTIYNCIFAYTDGYAIDVGGDDSTIENCYFHHIDYSCADLPSVMPAIYLHGNRIVFRRNTLHSFGASVGVLVGNEGITEYNNFYHGGYKQHDGAMVQVMVAKQRNARIGWNWVHDWPRLGIRFDGSGGQDGLVHHSVGWGPDMNSTVFIGNHDNNEIINNTGIFSAGRPEIVVESGGDPPVNNTHSITRNNLSPRLSGTASGVTPVPGHCDHNWTSAKTGQDICTQLRDPENLDFRPRAGADIIDAGVIYLGVTDGYIGVAPDIGAYEYGASHYWIPGHKSVRASCPVPPNRSMTVKPDADLMWKEGLGSLSHDVYLGRDPVAVATATRASPVFKGNQANNIYHPQVLTPGTYFWRVDTVTATGTVKGSVWAFAPTGSPVDADWNGIPDDWEITYFGAVGTSNGVAQVDCDGDSASNYSEYVADTDPTNMISVFKVFGTQNDAAEFALSFLSSSNRNYTVKSTTNLFSETWNTETNLVPGLGDIMNLVFPADNKKRFFRVEVSLP